MPPSPCDPNDALLQTSSALMGCSAALMDLHQAFSLRKWLHEVLGTQVSCILPTPLTVLLHDPAGSCRWVPDSG